MNPHGCSTALTQSTSIRRSHSPLGAFIHGRNLAAASYTKGVLPRQGDGKLGLPWGGTLREPRTKAAAGTDLVNSGTLSDAPVALKEWAVTCEALGSGEQIILLRKGGIREPAFRPQEQQFLLFPTAFHTETRLVKHHVLERYKEDFHFDPRNEHHLFLKYFACVTGSWATKDHRICSVLDDLHIWTDAYLEGRLKWRSHQMLTLLEIRSFVLDQPKGLNIQKEYLGCFSWVDLPKGFIALDDLQGATPALENEKFREEQAKLRTRLKQLEVHELYDYGAS